MANRKTPLQKKRVFSTGEVARICGLSLQTIIRCFDAGQISGFRVPGSRFRRIPRDNLIAFMRANNIPLDSLLTVKRKIMIVDDDEELAHMLSDHLQATGAYEIRLATTGFDAGVITQKFRPDLMLLDVMLPDINGREVCKSVKSDPDTNRTKIIVISGLIEEDTISDLYDVGADDYIRKPFDLEDLSNKVKEYLSEI